MPDMKTVYLGLELKNPLVAAAGPLCKDVSYIRHMEDVGISAVVLHSLFEEQIVLESMALDEGLESGSESFAESLSYFPDLRSYNVGPEGYLNHVRKAKEAVDIPVIGSLNGVTPGGWTRYARLIEEAGADALELNLYSLPTDPDISAQTIEDEYCDLVRQVRQSISIPLAVKIGSGFTSIPHAARALCDAGADGLVLFNRFYQPDFDLQTLEVTPNLVLSNPHELLLRIHWVAILFGRIKADMAITGGIHTETDIIKAMMAGARVAMVTSCLLRNGIDYGTHLLECLTEWMIDREYESIRQMQGSMSYLSVADPSAFERGNYMKVLSSFVLRHA